MNQPPQLVLFDVDGTLTRSDTMFSFAMFVAGKGRLFLALWLVSPVLVGMKLGLVDRGRAKGLLLRVCFGGITQSALQQAAARFAVERLPSLLRPGAPEQVKAYLDAGDRVLLVSASLDLWLAPIAEALGVGLISTEAAWKNGRFVGLAGVNCRGPEKVRRILERLDLADFSRSIAYGDSSGDREMLAMADEGHFQPFRSSDHRI
jgi:HAD superfamily hydrolase (TIGR01490 family)